MLGQRGELLQYAARPGEQVTIGVLEGMQTAIVEAGAQVVVNFNHFFQEASGLLLPAEDLTVTLSRQMLNESGRPLPGTVEELSPSDGRVSVSVGGDAGQHFANIADAVLDDSGVYAIEVCSESGTPEEVCQRANVTLFVLDCEFVIVLIRHSLILLLPYPVEPEGPFSVECSSTLNSQGNLLTVFCSSSTSNIASLNCTYDNILPSEDCRE